MKFFVIENGARPTAASHAERHAVQYLFEQDDGPFHRTRIINRGISLATRQFVANCDADMLIFPEALRMAMQILRNGGRMVLPSSGLLYELRKLERSAAIASLDFERYAPAILAKYGRQNRGDISRLRRSHIGGVHLFDRKTLIECGGYNENFISWGFEDNEIIERFKTLGVGMNRIADYPLMHLSHRRSVDSSKRNPYYRSNLREYRRIARCSPDELRALIASGGLKLSSVPTTTSGARFESRFWDVVSRLGLLP